MDATIWGGVSLFSFVLLMIGLICLIIEMFTIAPRIPAGVAFVLFIIGIVRQADTVAQAVIMITVICVIFGLLLQLFRLTYKNRLISHSLPALNKRSGNKAGNPSWPFVKAVPRRKYRA